MPFGWHINIGELNSDSPNVPNIFPAKFLLCGWIGI